MRLYVGNLPYSTRDDSLRQLFTQFGDVISATVIMMRDGRSKGFGFVELADDAARAAIEKLNGAEHEGRKLVVNEARPMVEDNREAA